MSWIDEFLLGLKGVRATLTPLPSRSVVSFQGPGVVVTDDATNLQTVVTIAGGGLSPSQTGIALVGGALNSNVAVTSVTSIRFTGCTTGTELGGMAISPTPAAGVPFDVEFDGPISLVDSDASSSAGNRILTGTGGPVLLPPGQKPRARFVRTVKSGVSTYNLQSTGVHQNAHTVNVKNFGATGNGVTDDTAAIQAAIDYLTAATDAYGNGIKFGGGTLYFPDGTYVISAELLFTPNVPVHIRGAGRNSTVIMQTALANGIHFPFVPSPTFTWSAVTSIRDLTVATSQNALNNNTLNNVWHPHTAVSLNQIAHAPGPSNRLLKCTSAGTTGAFPPFSLLWSGVPSAPTTNPFSITPQPQLRITGASGAWYKMVLVRVDTAGTIAAGTIVYSYSFDGISFTTGQTTTVGVTTYTLTDGGGNTLTLNFLDGSATYPKAFWSSPSYWQGFSVIVGDVLTDGSAQWTVIDGPNGILVEGSTVNIDHVNVVGFVNGVVLAELEIAQVRHMDIETVNGLWIVSANQRQNAATDTPLPNGFNNVLAFRDLNLGVQMMGIADGGGGGHVFDDCNFEGPFYGGYYMWIAGVNQMDASNWVSEGAPGGGVFLGGQAPFTGEPDGPSDTLRFRTSSIEPSGGSPIISGGTTPPVVTWSGLPATTHNEYGIVIIITTGSSTLSSVRFKWSYDGGQTYTTGVTPTGSAQALGGTGVSVTFPTGTYNTDNVYLKLGDQRAEFEASWGPTFASCNNFLAEACLLPNGQNGSGFGFVNAGFIGGITLRDNKYTTAATFLDTDNPTLNYGTVNATVIWSHCNGDRPGIGINGAPLFPGIDLNAPFGMRSRSLTLSATENDYQHPGVSTLVITTTGDTTITGITGGFDGMLLRIINPNQHKLTLSHQSGSSLAVNRFVSPSATDYTIGSDTPPAGGFNSVDLQYIGGATPATTGRWYIIGASWS